jgi:hypothetical protein
VLTSLTIRQVAALVGLRRRMVRSRALRAGLVLAAAGVPSVLALGVWAGAHSGGSPHADWWVPALFASVAVVAALAPLAVGGGYQLFPEDHLVAFPVRPATVAAGSLLLSPLNLSWLAQVLGAATATGYLTGTGPRLLLAALTTTAYVALACVLGAAISWAIVGARARRAGRLAVGAVAFGLGSVTWLVLATGHGRGALARLPSSWVISLVEEAYTGSPARWATGFAVIVLAAVVAAGATVRACAWALKRVPDRPVTAGAVAPVRRRGPQRSIFRELLAVDRASVWRAAPLRRGIAMLCTVPGAAAALSGVEWSSVVMLPAIVAAGTGLLFGINVFCLDAGGAVWLATLPHDPRTAFLAKARVLGELCVLTSTATVLVAACRATARPDAAQLSAVAAALVLGPVLVVAACMAISVRRPHRAELRGPRDTPAPPGAMFANTLALSITATVTGAVLAAFSFDTAHPWRPLVVGLLLAVPAAASVWRGSLRWRDPARRAGVVAAVSAG